MYLRDIGMIKQVRRINTRVAQPASNCTFGVLLLIRLPHHRQAMEAAGANGHNITQ